MPCVCGQRVDRNKVNAKVQCAKCGEFFHLGCVGLLQSDLEFLLSSNNKYLCKDCQATRRASIRSPPLCPSPTECIINNTKSSCLSNTQNQNVHIAKQQPLPTNQPNQNVNDNNQQVSLLTVLNEITALKIEYKSAVTMLNTLQSEKQLLVEKTEHMHSEIKAMRKSHAEEVLSAISTLTKEVKELRRIACSCKCANKNVKSASKQLSPKSAVNLPSTASPSLQLNPLPAVEEGNKSNQLLQTAQPIEQRNSNKVSCSATVVDSAAAVTASYADVAKSTSHPEQNASAADASASAANSASAHSNKPKVKALTRRIVVGSSSNDELNVAHRMKWLHLSSFKPSVTANNIIAYVSKHSSISSEMISCYSLVKKDVAVDSLKRVNFKLGVCSNHYDSLLNSELWPAGVKVRPFKFFQERVNKEVTT